MVFIVIDWTLPLPLPLPSSTLFKFLICTSLKQKVQIYSFFFEYFKRPNIKAQRKIKIKLKKKQKIFCVSLYNSVRKGPNQNKRIYTNWLIKRLTYTASPLIQPHNYYLFLATCIISPLLCQKRTPLVSNTLILILIFFFFFFFLFFKYRWLFLELSSNQDIIKDPSGGAS